MGTLLVTCAACISHLCSFLHWCLTLMYGLNPSSTPFSKSNGFDSLSYPVHLQAKFAEHQLLHFLPGILFGYLSQQLGSWWYEIFLHQKLLVFVRGVSFLKLHPWSECKISGWPKVEKILISSPVANPSSCLIRKWNSFSPLCVVVLYYKKVRIVIDW